MGRGVRHCQGSNEKKKMSTVSVDKRKAKMMRTKDATDSEYPQGTAAAAAGMAMVIQSYMEHCKRP